MAPLSKLVMAFALLAYLAKAEGFTPRGKYDLSPEDLDELCAVVEKGQTGKPPHCMYMKWVECEHEKGTKNRPCGWYKQERCDTKRSKREAEEFEEPKQLSSDGQPIFLAWPENK